MAVELVKALLTIMQYCTDCGNCAECNMREFCGKCPNSWTN